MSIILPPLLNLSPQPNIACVFADFRSGNRTVAQWGDACSLPPVILPTDVICFFGYCNNGFADSTGPNGGTPVVNSFGGDAQLIQEQEVSGRRHSMIVVQRVNVASAAAIQPNDRTFSWFVSVTGSRWLTGTMVFRGARVAAGFSQPDLMPRSVNLATTGNAPNLTGVRTIANQVAVGVRIITSAADVSVSVAAWPSIVSTSAQGSGGGARSIVRTTYQNFAAPGTTTAGGRTPAPANSPASALLHFTPI